MRDRLANVDSRAGNAGNAITEVSKDRFLRPAAVVKAPKMSDRDRSKNGVVPASLVRLMLGKPNFIFCIVHSFCVFIEFAPTCSPEQLKALRDLDDDYDSTQHEQLVGFQLVEVPGSIILRVDPA